MEPGESIADCLRREFLEETGLSVDVRRLLYVGERTERGRTVIHITFEVKRKRTTLTFSKVAQKGRMVPIGELERLGFGVKLAGLAYHRFRNAGSYVGPIESIGLT